MIKPGITSTSPGAVHVSCESTFILRLLRRSWWLLTTMPPVTAVRHKAVFTASYPISAITVGTNVCHVDSAGVASFQRHRLFCCIHGHQTKAHSGTSDLRDISVRTSQRVSTGESRQGPSSWTLLHRRAPLLPGRPCLSATISSKL